MTTMHVREPGGEREFRVPLDGPLPGGPFTTGRAELLVRTAPPGDAPTGVGLRIHLDAFEFQAWIPRLIEIFELPYDAFDLGAALGDGDPVLVFEAAPEVVARVPAGLAGLEAMNAFMRTGPALFDLGEYRLGAIDFVSGVASG
jgi:hypothetical protein